MDRHSGDNKWAQLDGSPWKVSGLELELTNTKKPGAVLTNLECGWYYRWRVRAVDKAGNKSEFSNHFTFTIGLD